MRWSGRRRPFAGIRASQRDAADRDGLAGTGVLVREIADADGAQVIAGDHVDASLTPYDGVGGAVIRLVVGRDVHRDALLQDVQAQAIGIDDVVALLVGIQAAIDGQRAVRHAPTPPEIWPS
ncbi:hypothetical protein G6F22_018327 [Rhizopus arrhizus]|nr:hypothetical protein G6F22_018327 [Rhizopus arrhizus]